ncbi:Gfo/Idh/MocA family oxidoreductase [Neomoorella humiferrea]|uniref:Gfo/Idh/MocA family protein n=1 Tax=Neomoorella humiferrea TaxID=676965 RepID=UPI003D8FD606
MKIGILSFAHMHAYSYAGALTRLPGVEFAGLADDDASRGRAAAAQFGTRYFPTIDALLETDIDGVIICSANAEHASMALAAASHGKHILCEKPIATTIEDAARMIAACQENNVQLGVAFPCRFHPAARRLRQEIQAGKLGRVIAIRATNHGSLPPGWFLDREKAGGGAVMDHTVHVVDLLRWFLGQEVIRVYAEAGTLLYDINVEDCGLLSMELSGGVFVTLDTSWSRPPGFPTWGDVTMEIIGTAGTAYLDLFAQNLAVYGPGELTTRYENWGSDADYIMVREFVSCIAGNRRFPVSGHDGLKALEVALAAYRAAETNAPVAVGN